VYSGWANENAPSGAKCLELLEVTDQRYIDAMLPDDEDGAEGGSPATYKVEVYTGDVKYAGTDANVYITLYGVEGDSGFQKLKAGKTKNLFERDQIDTFEVMTDHDLGPLHKIRVKTDGTGLGAGWFLGHVLVTPQSLPSSPSAGGGSPNDEIESLYFGCNQWFDVTEGDGLLDRELKPGKKPRPGG